ncbi:aspartyl-tRNA(Asn)/glutamyl-tRNA(Gln) amidotransferase subunit A/mandelamide amidase [Hoeflea marina]|uniref:Aspartyl-tRNA(Asn)/glutamyl-tRNA(Gln) amidotransferase subunit A/mandelamide amidase n=1 Tax=Hoeflea marina TaxID=274592 RepID=A0A317PNW4_9HYPH|nr:amidase [Hoeflea marina]PWW01941.1 aspartyl-tRNA(Asn)/glutamyl-tRNA(Gln) amidotransferase subunit A/mandelamide amidase [Hoeflea marina]
MADDIAIQAVERSLAAIAADNDRLRAVTCFDAGRARARAARQDGDGRGVLYGLTFVAKDLIDVADLPTSGGSRLFDDVPAAVDADCVRRLSAAGAVVIGKSNMHELAVGGAVNPWFGQVVNPLSAEHGTGGTSSGSAAAVASGMCDFALGTDSGGSNRSPAAATGLFGFKPTNGILPLDGVRRVAPTLDTVGLLARDASVLRQAFAALSGQPPRESCRLEDTIVGRPIGLHGPVDAPVQRACDEALSAVRSAGGRIVDVSFAGAGGLVQAGKHILRHEFAREYGEKIAERGNMVGADVRAFTEACREISAARYEDALALIAVQRSIWRDAMEGVDAILVPTAPGLAPRIADEFTRIGDSWRPYGAAGAEFRMWANTVGIPAVAIPVPMHGGLPASVQLAARHGADGFLIDLSAALGRQIAKQRAAPTKKRGMI